MVNSLPSSFLVWSHLMAKTCREYLLCTGMQGYNVMLETQQRQSYIISFYQFLKIQDNFTFVLYKQAKVTLDSLVRTWHVNIKFRHKGTTAYDYIFHVSHMMQVIIFHEAFFAHSTVHEYLSEECVPDFRNSLNVMMLM